VGWGLWAGGWGLWVVGWPYICPLVAQLTERNVITVKVCVGMSNCAVVFTVAAILFLLGYNCITPRGSVQPKFCPVLWLALPLPGLGLSPEIRALTGMCAVPRPIGTHLSL
jgi:hypothetical protein